MRKSDFIIENIRSVTIWKDVLNYQPLDWRTVLSHLTLMDFLDNFRPLRHYLKERSKNNQEYKEFWANEDRYIFNEDKTQYIVMHCNQIGDVTIE